MSERNRKIARDFGIMCGFIEFSPDFPPDQQGDFLYQEFIKRTGETLSKEELAKIIQEEMDRQQKAHNDYHLRIVSAITKEEPKEQQEVFMKVKINDFKL